MNTQQRAHAIAKALQALPAAFHQSAEDLLAALASELGSPSALDEWQSKPHGRHKAQARSPLLHIISGNTPHAGIQSLCRGLLLGATPQWVKLPRHSPLPEVTQWHQALAPELQSHFHFTTEIPDAWWQDAAAVVAFGSEKTLQEIAAKLRHDQHLQAHGHKFSIALLGEMPDRAGLDALANDIGRHQQSGCLSVTHVFVQESQDLHALAIAEALAEALQRHETQSPRGEISAQEAAKIASWRAEAHYLESLAPTEHRLWESAQNSSWTLRFQAKAALVPSPLNRCVWVHPAPQKWSDLGSEIRYLSTIALHPCTDALAATCAPLQAPRLCALGETQNPPACWHPDGIAALADLVTWQDRDW